MNGVHIKRHSTHTQAYAHHRAARFAIALQMLISYHHSSPSQFSRRMVSICLPPFHLKRHKQNVIIFALFLLFLSLHRFFFGIHKHAHRIDKILWLQMFVCWCVNYFRLTLIVFQNCVCTHSKNQKNRNKTHAWLLTCASVLGSFLFFYSVIACQLLFVSFVARCAMCILHISRA